MLKERCNILACTKDEEFVGIKCVDGKVEVNFPLGYRFYKDSAAKTEDEADEARRKDILLLVDVLATHSEAQEAHVVDGVEQNKDLQKPIYAYLYVIRDYVEHGYYKNYIVDYVNSKRGKINWSRTIKQKKPLLHEDDAIYLEFITKKTMVNENDLVTLIHQYCVYISFLRVGWLFTEYMPEEPLLPYNKDYFLAVISQKLHNTFDDKDKMLFSMLLKIIQDADDNAVKSNNFTYGTKKFYTVWESMIDSVYGISDKQRYYPKTYWTKEDKFWCDGDDKYSKGSLRPDTIMKLADTGNNDIYILDAKYYQFSKVNKTRRLPGSADINKQITYGEYIAFAMGDISEKYRNHELAIYNAFVLPNNDAEKPLQYLATAHSSWKTEKNSYESIQGILLDVKYLMEMAGRKNNSEIEKMAQIIMEHCKTRSEEA